MYGQAAAPSSWPLAVTGDATAHTKGNYVEYVASTPFDTCGIIISVGYCQYGYYYLFDVAIGAAGSEQVIIPDLTIHSPISAALFQVATYFFPIHIPRGSRIALRSQSSTGGKYIRPMIYLISGGAAQPAGLNRVLCYGLTGNSEGTEIDPGTSSNTKGGFVEIVSSLVYPLKGFVLGIGNTDFSRASGEWLIDVAIGAAGSEQVILPDYHAATSTSTTRIGPIASPFIPIAMPIGTRISVRSQSSLTTTDRLLDVFIYGVS
jgi:hypothetical protein